MKKIRLLVTILNETGPSTDLRGASNNLLLIIMINNNNHNNLFTVGKNVVQNKLI